MHKHRLVGALRGPGQSAKMVRNNGRGSLTPHPSCRQQSAAKGQALLFQPLFRWARYKKLDFLRGLRE